MHRGRSDDHLVRRLGRHRRRRILRSVTRIASSGRVARITQPGRFDRNDDLAGLALLRSLGRKVEQFLQVGLELIEVLDQRLGAVLELQIGLEFARHV